MTDYWSEMSYNKFKLCTQHSRLEYEQWIFEIDKKEIRIDYDEDTTEE